MLHEVAWAAGLFEGEGYVTTTRRVARVHPQLGLGMTDEEIVGRFTEIVDLGHINWADPRPSIYSAAPKRLFRWRTTGHENCNAVLVRLWPWLGSRRRAQIGDVMSRCGIPDYVEVIARIMKEAA